MDIKTAFRTGFFKKATAAGLSPEQVTAVYNASIHKLAYGFGNDLPLSTNEGSDFKDQMRQQGMPPVLEGPDQSFQAQDYNRQMIGERDRLARQNPDMATAQGAVVGGGIGAAAGGIGGHYAGHANASALDPAKFSPEFRGKMPSWMRTGGMLMGALAGGVPTAMHNRHKVEVAQKMEDPRNLEMMIRQMSQERHLANNQFGQYGQ